MSGNGVLLEPLRQLPFTPRPFPRETIGSFVTRLASANRIRMRHMLQLTAIRIREQWTFTLAADHWTGWSPSTPHRIAALAGRDTGSLAAAFPAVAAFLADPDRPPPSAAQDSKLQRACRQCAAARNITSLVIVQARPRDYLCVRHHLWLRGLPEIDLRPLPQVTEAQLRHDRKVRKVPASDVAAAHQQARDVIEGWLTLSWHPELTARWQQRLRMIGADDARYPSTWLDVVTHPELLAVARLLLGPARLKDTERDAQALLDFPYQPSWWEPLARTLRQSGKTTFAENKKLMTAPRDD